MGAAEADQNMIRKNSACERGDAKSAPREYFQGWVSVP
jgi:hypothetical protein